MIDLTAIYREDATEEEQIRAFQELINTGQAWQMEGSIGRTAMDLIDQGVCTLGPEGHKDAYGNYVPSKDEVQPGSKGSEEYVKERQQ